MMLSRIHRRVLLGAALSSVLVLPLIHHRGYAEPLPPYMKGLIEPAVVSDSVYISIEDLPSGASVTYSVDGKVVDVQTTPPYWMGGAVQDRPNGFQTRSLPPGEHRLQADIVGPGIPKCSLTSRMTVVPSINEQFSQILDAYPNHFRENRLSLEQVLARTSTPGAALSPEEQETRQRVLAMYMNWGIDPSLDYKHFKSTVLLDQAPRHWAPPRSSSSTNIPRFSPDAPFYHRLSSQGPAVSLPVGYINTVQLNTVEEGDGIGYGIVVSPPGTGLRLVTSQWYGQAATRAIYQFPIPAGWSAHLPWQANGDRHVIFVDPSSDTFLSAYKTSADIDENVHGLYVSPPTSFNSLGDRGGSTSAGFAELPLLVQPGELTNPDKPIDHAIGGPVHRTWMARVFPATSWDYGLDVSTDTCTGRGFTNTGLVPYGGIIRLDPALNLRDLHLTLPAFRLLQAMQDYGYYVMDYGCSDLDIYTSISESELDAFGGLWGYNKQGVGVQNEIRSVISASTLYVLPPQLKKQ